MTTPPGSTAESRLPITEPQNADPNKPPPPPSPWSTRALARDIDPRFSDLPLFACSFTSGLCDSVTVNACSTFVSMQTGNTIFLSLGVSSQPSNEPSLWLRSLVSLASFSFGCLCFSNTRRLGPRRKGVLAASFLLQAVLIVIAAALAESGVVGEFDSPDAARRSEGHKVLAAIALLAWQFGGQISSSRMLGFGEVPTCVLTSVYCDLFSDPKLLAPLRENPKRNRRIGAVLSLLIGGIASGWIQRAERGMIIVLWIAAGIKFVLAFAWVFWKAKGVEEDE